MPFADLRQKIGRCREAPARNECGKGAEPGLSSQEIGPDPGEDEVGNRHPSQRRGRANPPRQPGRRIPEPRLGVPDQGPPTEPGGVPRRGTAVASDLGGDPNVLGQEDARQIVADSAVSGVDGFIDEGSVAIHQERARRDDETTEDRQHKDRDGEQRHAQGVGMSSHGAQPEGLEQSNPTRFYTTSRARLERRPWGSKDGLAERTPWIRSK